MTEPLLDIRGLVKHFAATGPLMTRSAGVIRAVDGVSLRVRRGETLGLVGESGCGKSTLARMILHLERPTAGEIRFEGRDILSFGRDELRQFRRSVQMVFQDPYSSLNPRQTAGAIIGEPLVVHREHGGAGGIGEKVRKLAAVVGLDEEQLKRYPHEFSGGQRQRIGIARALVLDPTLVIADEPVSALDVSIRAQILNLLKRLQREFALTYLFITHDLGVVRHMSDRIAVMYLGKIVECGPAGTVCDTPGHPYTRALLAAVPSMNPVAGSRRPSRPAEMPSPLVPPTGCGFYTRCPLRDGRCAGEEPVLQPRGEEHQVACHRLRDR